MPQILELLEFPECHRAADVDLIPRRINTELDPQLFARKQSGAEMARVDRLLHITRKQLVYFLSIYFLMNRHVTLFYHKNDMIVIERESRRSGAGGNTMATVSQLGQPLVEQLPEEVEDSIPQNMDPGTVFVFQKRLSLDDLKPPYVAAMACPLCGCICLITYRQLDGKDWMLCVGECSAEWSVEHHLDDTAILLRRPQ